MLFVHPCLLFDPVRAVFHTVSRFVIGLWGWYYLESSEISLLMCLYDEVARPRHTQSPEADVTGRRIWTEDGNEPSRQNTWASCQHCKWSAFEIWQNFNFQRSRDVDLIRAMAIFLDLCNNFWCFDSGTVMAMQFYLFLLFHNSNFYIIIIHKMHKYLKT